MFQPLLDAYIESSKIEEVSFKPSLSIAVASWHGKNEAEEFKKSILYFILNQYYQITLHTNSNEFADIVVSSPIGATRNILSYTNCKRLFYTGENQAPDFNLFDYAIGFNELDFNQRYLRMPLYYANLHHIASSINDSTSCYPIIKPDSLYCKSKPKSVFKTKHPNLHAVVNGQTDPFKREFASFVASNAKAPMRNAFYDALSSIGVVAGGGRVKNTLGYNVSNKAEFLSHYKFNLCFENTKGYGYVTEKIIDAYFAHTIPIYWGSPSVAKDFNPKSFVNVHDFKDFNEAIDFVRYLHTHKNAYLDMLYENPLNCIDGKSYFYQNLSFKKIAQFFSAMLERDEIYHSNNPFIWYYDLYKPLVLVDGLKEEADSLKKELEIVQQEFEPFKPLLKTRSFKAFHKLYKKTSPLRSVFKKIY